jgi:carbamoylphosphate synthase small subunit
VLSCQFHPEGAPGPRDSLWVFDEFVKTAAAFSTEKEMIPCRPAGI